MLFRSLEDHNRWTGSRRARELLDGWSTARLKFVKVFPNEYKRALGEMQAAKVKDETIVKANSDLSARSVPAK